MQGAPLGSVQSMKPRESCSLSGRAPAVSPSLGLCFFTCKMKRLDQTVPQCLSGTAIIGCSVQLPMSRGHAVLSTDGSPERVGCILNGFKRGKGLQVTEKRASQAEGRLCAKERKDRIRPWWTHGAEE